jgi:1-acyl-sn-glycerol-3-phosphate acyltransferase
MIIYVAGPMTGLPEYNYPAFHHAADELKQAGYIVLNPADNEELNTSGQTQSWNWYIRHALRMLLDADGLALLPEWENSRGAQLEVHLAHAIGMPARAVDDWLAL